MPQHLIRHWRIGMRQWKLLLDILMGLTLVRCGVAIYDGAIALGNMSAAHRQLSCDPQSPLGCVTGVFASRVGAVTVMSVAGLFALLSFWYCYQLLMHYAIRHPRLNGKDAWTATHDKLHGIVVRLVSVSVLMFIAGGWTLSIYLHSK